MGKGDDGKHEGMARAERAANPVWTRAAMEATLEAAKILPKLTTDDVLLMIDPSVSTHEMRALGPVMQNAAREGWIEKAQTLPVNCATRPSNHSRPLQVWRSLVYRGDANAQQVR
jgi:hypothetical protein